MTATPPPAPTALQVFDCPLEGIGLIEASAGTGKTWAICGLYLRLLLERGLDVQHILVVTFTNAATAELRDRIRQRIADTLAQLRGAAATPGDEFVPTLLRTLRERHGLDDATMVTRLDLALHTFDEASIFTIHGFCQRALSDTPFSAQMPLALELVQDDGELLREVVQDFWRRRIAGDRIDPALAAYLGRRHDEPAGLARLLKRHLAKPLAIGRWPAAMDTAPALDAAALQQAHDDARALWLAGRDDVVQLLQDALPSLNANSYKAASISTAAAAWDTLLAGADAAAALAHDLDKKAALLGAERLAKGTKKGGSVPQHAFFAAAQRLLDRREAGTQSLVLARLRLLRTLLDEGSSALREAKRQRRIVAFDDMLFNLHQRLQGERGAGLAQALRARFPAALIDEFQDTDPLQFSIFGTIYAGAGHRGDAGGAGPLFLVGDPKQAIYSFRNADLHTYLQARGLADAAYTLAHNQRSSPALIDALNALFGANPAAFMLPGLHYHPVALGSKPRKPLEDRTLPRAPLQVWTLPKQDGSDAPLPKAEARQAVIGATAAEIARLIAGGQRGEILLAGAPLRAGDIAVLVRSHRQGSDMRQALAALGVGSVELSQASVHHSPDAEELERLLAGILEPTREPRLKAALSTTLIGLDAAAIDALAADEARLAHWVQVFGGWRETWIERGIGVLLRRLVAEARMADRFLVRPDGERRLTNLLHLAECLHQAAEQHPAPEALLRWLQAQRETERGDDSTQLRLESDQNLVQIVTIHKSKGLEYPIVFCPFLWEGRLPGAGSGIDGVEYHDDDGRSIIDYRRDVPAEYDEADVKRRTRGEQAAEFLRLVYVALTRAVHRCVLVAGCYQAKVGRNESTSESCRSLLNWLVAGAGRSPQAWLDGGSDVAGIDAAWTALAERHAPALAVEPLPALAAAVAPALRVAPEALAALPPPDAIPAGWRIGSYSSLAHGSRHDDAARDTDLRVEDAPPPAEAAATVPAPTVPDEDDILHFPRGSAAGDCLHALLEAVDFDDPSHWPEAIVRTLQAHRGTLPPEAHEPTSPQPARARMLQRLLADLLGTPLPLGTPQPLLLSRLPRGRLLKELEFHLPAPQLDAGALTRLLRAQGYPVPRLDFGTLHGYLKGFIDLVLEHEGRYFIVDWKSNHLGERPAHYGPAALDAAMAGQGYHLQALLYSVALHRHLRHRLAGYRPEQHLGGFAYLFIRGLRPAWRNDDGTPTGLFFHRPTVDTLQRLDALLGDRSGQTEPAGATGLPA